MKRDIPEGWVKVKRAMINPVLYPRPHLIYDKTPKSPIARNRMVSIPLKVNQIRLPFEINKHDANRDIQKLVVWGN